MQAPKDEDQPPIANDANAALLAWYRHLQTERLATKEEIARVRDASQGLGAELQTPIEPVAVGRENQIANDQDSSLSLAGPS
jgi:hypothetical protein